LFINLNVKEMKILTRRPTIACGWWSRSWRLAMSQRHGDGKNNGNNGSKNSKWNVWNSHFPLSLPSLLLPKNPLSLKKKKKRLREREREREKRQRILEKSETNMQKMVLNVEGRGNGIYIENMNTGIVPIFIGSNMPYGLQFSMPFSL